MSPRLTIVIHSLNGGGAERTAATLANQFLALGYPTTLITLDSSEHDTYPVDARVCRVGLDVMGASRHKLQAVFNNVRRIVALRRAIRDSRPDHVISLTDKTNVVTLLACWGLSVPVVIAERTDPRRHEIGRLWSCLRRLTYPRCQALVVQTEVVRQAVRAWTHGKPIYVIPNAVEPPAQADVVEDLETPVKHRQFVALGRLEASKGFDLLLQAFAELVPRHPDWKLAIFGEGPQRAELEAYIVEQQLGDRVQLPGWVDDPTRELRRSEAFVLSSRYEGFPNALLEAMACGIPAVAFDCDSGPRDIIRHEVDGLLVPAGDVRALANAMERLMSDEALRQRLASRAADVLERFGTDLYLQRWQAVLQQLPEDSCVAHGSDPHE